MHALQVIIPDVEKATEVRHRNILIKSADFAPELGVVQTFHIMDDIPWFNRLEKLEDHKKKEEDSHCRS